jgi:transposase
LIQAYKDLSRVERAFRSMKSVDLEIRPIRHWSADRLPTAFQEMRELAAQLLR